MSRKLFILLFLLLTTNAHAQYYKAVFNPYTSKFDYVGAISVTDLSSGLCVAGQVLKKNAGNTAWECAADNASGGIAGTAPADATYLTLTTNGTLTVERVFTAGDGISGTDAGAGSTYTIAVNLKDTPENGVGTTSSASGMEFESNELTLLQGCDDTEVLQWSETTDSWSCQLVSSSGGGGSCWEENGDGDLMPVSGSCTDSLWEENGDGDLMPQT